MSAESLISDLHSVVEELASQFESSFTSHTNGQDTDTNIDTDIDTNIDTNTNTNTNTDHSNNTTTIMKRVNDLSQAISAFLTQQTNQHIQLTIQLDHLRAENGAFTTMCKKLRSEKVSLEKKIARLNSDLKSRDEQNAIQHAMSPGLQEQVSSLLKEVEAYRGEVKRATGEETDDDHQIEIKKEDDSSSQNSPSQQQSPISTPEKKHRLHSRSKSYSSPVVANPPLPEFSLSTEMENLKDHISHLQHLNSTTDASAIKLKKLTRENAQLRETIQSKDLELTRVRELTLPSIQSEWEKKLAAMELKSQRAIDDVLSASQNAELVLKQQLQLQEQRIEELQSVSQQISQCAEEVHTEEEEDLQFSREINEQIEAIKLRIGECVRDQDAFVNRIDKEKKFISD